MPQTKKKKETGTGLKIKFREPSLYDVIMLNDDFTTMDFVVKILTDIFDKNQPEAVELMLKVHKEGQAAVARYPYDIADTKVKEAIDRARAENFPFQMRIDRV